MPSDGSDIELASLHVIPSGFVVDLKMFQYYIKVRFDFVCVVYAV